jgi:hypothetical protein
MSTRRHMRPEVEAVKKEFLQAKANYDIVK